MKLKEHNECVLEQIERKRDLMTGVMCDECDKELRYRNQMTLGRMEYPERRRVYCECGFEGIIILL